MPLVGYEGKNSTIGSIILKSCFLEFDETLRERVIRKHNTLANNHPVLSMVRREFNNSADLMSILEEAGSNFVDMRYSCEIARTHFINTAQTLGKEDAGTLARLKASDKATPYLGLFAQGLNEEIIARHPEWRVA